MYTYVLAMEVLDNLPHDCVVRQDATSDWREVIVQREDPGGYQMAQRRLQDPLIQQSLQAADWGGPASGADADLCVTPIRLSSAQCPMLQRIRNVSISDDPTLQEALHPDRSALACSFAAVSVPVTAPPPVATDAAETANDSLRWGQAPYLLGCIMSAFPSD